MATFLPALANHPKQPLNWQTLSPAQRSLLMDSTIIVLLFLLALILRLPYLHDVPRYPWDELRESGVALSIARGEAFPLTNFDSYIGALYNYLLAGAFFVFGEHPSVPHLVVAFICSATAPILYLFGKEIDSRATGFIAAALFSCNAQQIFNGSHWGYSNSLTPVFSTLALWLSWRALKSKRPWSLLVGAFAFGLALQTHPSAIVLVPAIVITFFFDGRQWLRSRWPYLAIGAATLGYADVIVYNISTRGGSLVAGLAQRQHYASGRSLTLDMYPANFLRGIGMFMSLFEGSGIWGDTPVPQWLRTLFFGILLLSLSIGYGLLVLRRDNLIPLALISSLVLVPFVVGYWVDHHRYWMLTLPPGLIAVALCITSAARWAAARYPAWPTYAASCLLVGILALYPLPALWRMYRARVQVHPTNREMERLAVLAQNSVATGEIVLVDEAILLTPKPDESAPARTLSYLLLLNRVPAITVLHQDLPRWAFAQTGQPCLLIVPPSSPVLDSDVDRPPGFQVEPDIHSPSKELGLSVGMVHVKSE
jgi:4-amino-4-deoxy-L-arabinose transferase-like glycosyltransferase